MTNKTEKQLREAFNEGFKKAHTSGLLQGTKAISKVVLDKATDTRKTPDERLADIIKFCEVSLKDRN